MTPITNLADLGFTFYKLSYEEWATIEEPSFFNFAVGDHKKAWLQLDKDACLSVYSGRVSLLKVGGTFYKLDGKQRKKIWESKTLRPPEFLIAEVYEIPESTFSYFLEQALAIENDFLLPNEVIKTVYNELGLGFISERFKSGYIKESLDIALRGKLRKFQNRGSKQERLDINIKKALLAFESELAFIDSLDAKTDIFVTGVVAGSLIMLGLGENMEKIETFLRLLNEGQGETKDGVHHDPVAALLKCVTAYAAQSKPQRHTKAVEICSRTIQAIELWIEGPASAKFWRKNQLGGINHVPYVIKMKSRKKLLNDLDL